MDTTKQLYEADATGWKRGVYDDIQRTFRAPFINWIFRTMMANQPEFLRYAWWQLKPMYETRAFARFSVEYRDGVLSAVDDDLPRYRLETVDVSPAEYRELRGQLATFDVLAPRLAVLFESMNRALADTDLGGALATDWASTAPYPDWLDADRGVPPTMASFDVIPDGLTEAMTAIREFHGFEEGFPSIYRCLAQWPPFLSQLWSDIEPVLTSGAFERARADGADQTARFVDSIPGRPRLTPSDLLDAGFERTTVDDVQALFRQFDRGPAKTVVPALPLFAATLDAAGERQLL